MVGGALLWLPVTASYGALLLCAVLIGAAGTLIIHHEGFFPPVFWLIVIGAVAIARRHTAWHPGARDTSVQVDRR